MQILRYPYKPGPLRMVAVILFFGAGAVFLGYTALNNTQGLILERVIQLSPPEATAFFWGSAVFSGLLALAGVSGFVSAFTSTKELILTDTELLAPASMWSRGVKPVRLSEIVRLEKQSVSRERFLNVYHSGGKLSISGSVLPSGALDKLYAELASRTRCA
jgi:hypothetical protein